MIDKININNIIMSIIPASYFIWSFDFSGAIFVLFILCVVDFITGIRKAKMLGCLSSRVAIEKSVSKIYNYGTILVVGYIVNMFVLSFEPSGYVSTFLMNCLGDFIEYVFILFAGFLIGVEAYSILENLASMGAPVPQKLMNRWSKNVRDSTCDDTEDNCKNIKQ